MTGSRAQPRFTTRRSVLLSAIIVGGFIVIAEGAARVIGVRDVTRPAIIARSMDIDVDFPFMRPDPSLLWAPRPGFAGSFLDRPVRINSLGLRGPELQRPKPRGRRRIGCFGDSITFGYGVGDAETYPAQLDARLRPGGAEVVNAGVTGYSSHQVALRLRDVAEAAELDVALFLVGWNDQTRRPVDDRAYARRARASRALEGVAANLHLYRALRNLYVRAVSRPAPGETTERVPRDHYRENLRTIVAECRARGIAPAFLAFPRRRLHGEAPVTSGHEDVLREVARERGVPVLDIGALDARAVDANGELFIDSLHFSPAGHAYLAERIAAQLPEMAAERN
jgi:lysophospholipase L1-like esterase